MPTNVFLTGEYLETIPKWHTGESPWKARGVLQMLQRNHVSPRRIGEVGCGTGEVLRQLQDQMDGSCSFLGYDISPDAIQLSESRHNARLQCRVGDIASEPDAGFDVLLVLDVVEHQENYFQFLRDIKPLAPYKLFHTVLDLSSQAVARKDGLMKFRRDLHDLHFFTKDLFLQALRAEGYQVIDFSYAPRRVYAASGLFDVIKQLPRTLSFAVHQDLAVRLLGGYSMFVLAQ
jgi:SAM-dependent methyltransferase